MRLGGKVAIVTGASRGIGKGIAVELAQEGAAVVVNYAQSRKMAEELVKAIISRGGRALAVQADVSKRGEVENMVEIGLREFGKIDILVNNAGIAIADLLVDSKEEDWHRVMNVNAKGVLLCCQAVARHMMARKGGKIINVASQAGKRGEQYNGVYCASKAAVISMTQTLAIELAPYGINVNAVCPGIVETKLMQDAIVERASLCGSSPEAYRENLIKLVPLGRIEQPEDVAKAVLFLASEYSDYMTGQSINITGGMIFH